ncbi:hypothetical protein Tco_0378060 [Tanacetum coccineum]
MSANSVVTYTSVYSEARSWSIPSEDPYEEAARQLLEQALRSPEWNSNHSVVLAKVTELRGVLGSSDLRREVKYWSLLLELVIEKWLFIWGSRERLIGDVISNTLVFKVMRIDALKALLAVLRNVQGTVKHFGVIKGGQGQKAGVGDLVCRCANWVRPLVYESYSGIVAIGFGMSPSVNSGSYPSRD